MNKKILITGGMGYIGSHTIVSLVEFGYEIISIDNFCNSKESVLDGIEKIIGKRIINYRIDITGKNPLIEFFNKEDNFDGIIHFAAFKAVEESVEKPLKYFHNNITGLINILECVNEFNIPNFIFSSSCTVYGQPDVLPVTEKSPIKKAESPYGLTKQIGEQILRDYFLNQENKRCISLRYFNPGGAHDSGYIGENPLFEAKNLVPIITETAIGKRKSMTVFGDNYNTRDGSCIRDYIHIQDLADAHRDALNYLMNENSSHISYDVFNLGVGEGVTVLEAINAFEKSTNKKLNYKIVDRRPGDVEAVYANHQKATKVLGWKPKRDIGNIMNTAWVWERNK